MNDDRRRTTLREYDQPVGEALNSNHNIMSLVSTTPQHSYYMCNSMLLTLPTLFVHLHDCNFCMHLQTSDGHIRLPHCVVWVCLYGWLVCRWLCGVQKRTHDCWSTWLFRFTIVSLKKLGVSIVEYPLHLHLFYNNIFLQSYFSLKFCCE